MKSIDEIRNMSLEELEHISTSEGTAPSCDIAARAMAIVRRQRNRRIAVWTSGIAASLVLVIGLGLNYREPALQDSFSDPYLAYAEVEKAFGKIGSAVSSSAETIDSSKEFIDNKLDKIFTSNK